MRNPANWLPKSNKLMLCYVVIRDVEHLKEVLQTCWEQIGQDVIDRAIGQFHKRKSLLQLVEDPLSIALTNVHGATCTLSNLCVLL